MAELAPHASKFETQHIDAVMQQCMARMPESLDGDIGSDEASFSTKAPYSKLEPLLYTFHQMVKNNPQYLTEASRAEQVTEFRKRCV